MADDCYSDIYKLLNGLPFYFNNNRFWQCLHIAAVLLNKWKETGYKNSKSKV